MTILPAAATAAQLVSAAELLDRAANSGAEIAGCMRKAANQLRDDAAFKEFGA